MAREYLKKIEAMMKFLGLESKERKPARAAGINPKATLSGHTERITALAVLPNGLLASGSYDKTIKLWTTSGACEKTLLGHTSWVLALTVLPNGLLVSGSDDRTIKLWTASGKCEKTLSEHTYGAVYALTVLPNGLLASGHGYLENSIKLWDVLSGRCVTTLSGHTYSVLALAVLPSGLLASGSGDSTIKLWTTSETYEMTLSWRAHTHALAVLPNGLLASSGDEDYTIKLWTEAGERAMTLLGHAGEVNALTVLPNGLLASGSSDETIKLWDIGLHPVPVQATSSIRVAAGPEKKVVGNAVREAGPVSLPAQAQKPILPPKPPKNVAAKVASEVSKGDHSTPPKLHSRVLMLSDGETVRSAINQETIVFKKTSDDIIFYWQQSDEITRKTFNQATINDIVRMLPSSGESRDLELIGKITSICDCTPSKSAAKKVASEVSERDHLPVFSALSLSQVAGTISFDELEIGRKLGQGGFGVVNEALWQGTTQVAVKQLLGQLTSDLIDEFQRETNVHARLRHPNIIMLYGICIEPLKVAMVMEFMASGSLYDVLKNPAALPWSLRLSIALDLVSGLLYLHTQHIIHRDLKSLNILVDDRMHAKVSDFGLSKIKLTTASMTRGGGGTTHWEAPELFDEAANTYATDVYATGIVFWEIAARKIPYEGKTETQIIRYVNSGKRETIPAGTPSQFATLMTRCWAQRAEDRPTMNEVAREMREIRSAEGRPGSASPAKPAAVDSGYAAFSRRQG